ncbi:hypothetical protein SAMN05421736_1593, partial [Evansella caseinilytica]
LAGVPYNAINSMKMLDDLVDVNKANMMKAEKLASEVADSAKIKLTEPSLPEGSKPRGNYANEVDRGIRRQNQTADLFAEKGYDIKMLDEVDGGNGFGKNSTSNPDFLIEGNPFDCYSPEINTSINNVSRTISKKTKNQSERIVLNLDDYPADKVDDLISVLLRKTNSNGDLKYLQELFIVKDGTITKVFER